PTRCLVGEHISRHLTIEDAQWNHDRVIFFFFHAEDGIRDGHVTGVQTCALPILEVNGGDVHPGRTFTRLEDLANDAVAVVNTKRSEERRVGKECRVRWGPCLVDENMV